MMCGFSEYRKSIAAAAFLLASGFGAGGAHADGATAVLQFNTFVGALDLNNYVNGLFQVTN